MKKLVLSRCSNSVNRAMPRYVAALGAWALLTVSAQAADFTWTFGPGVDVGKLAYGDGIDSAPGNAFYNGSMYFFEDREGKSAHVWKGTNLDALVYQYQAVLDNTFPVYAGDLGCWFAGLWIDPATGDFYSPVHHEFNKLKTPGFAESRRLGIAKSIDQGRHWTYLGDCLSSPNDDLKGPEYWKGDVLDAGCGDPHLFVDTKSGYFYLYYVNKYFLKSRSSNEHKMKVARCKISDRMAPGKWTKFYNGAWTEPGMGGKGTWLDKLQLFPDVKYSTYLGRYIAVGVNTVRSPNGLGIQTCTSMETQDWTNVENIGDVSPLTWGYPLLTDDANQADNGLVDQTMRIYVGQCAPAKCYYWPITLESGTSEKRVNWEYRWLITDENMYFEPNPMLNWNYPGRIAYESKSLNYVGSWTNSFDYDDDSGGTKYSDTAGDSVELSFPGDSVNVRVRKAPDAGKCDIYLDDLAVAVATGVDTYCASNSHAQSIFSKNGLAQGNHFVKLVVKGTHQASAAGNRIYLDTITFAKATPAYDCPDMPTGVSAKMHANGVALAWNSVTGASSYNVYRTTHASGVSNLGMIKKGVVGTSLIDTGAVERTEYYYRVTAVDADGKESLRSAIVHASWNAAGWITVNDNGASVSYSPGWAVWANDPALIQGDVHYSSATNAYCSFAFTGTGVRFIADKAANHGKCDVYLDGQLAAPGLDLYDTATVARYAAFHTNGLPVGAHTLKVVVTGARSDRATGCQVDVDAFEYVNDSASERKGVDASDALHFKVDKVSGAVSLHFGAELLNVPVDVRVGLPGWKKIIGAGECKEFVASDIPCGYRLTGRLELESGKACRIEEEITQEGDSCRIRIRLTAEESLAMEGAFLWLDLPVPAYAGSACTLGAAPAVVFPYTFTEAGTRFINGEADKVVIEDTLGTKALTLEFDSRAMVRVQDARAWKSDVYNFYVAVTGKTLEKGETAQLSVKLRRLQAKDLPPCNLRVVPERTLGRMDGFGGNYCFEIESPVTQYTLKNLRVAWARTEMTPAEWEPRNDNDDPGKTDWEFLKAQDAEGSNLRREFLLAQQIQTSGIPYSITIWRLPEWCYVEPVQGLRLKGGAIKEGFWPEILECIGSYLIYAKKTYGVEPDFFSFNEPNGNTYVKFTPEDHRDAIRRIGAHFKALGLKTRMLLGDVSFPGAYDFILPAANDAEAMRHVGALSFHTWGGANPAGYEKWAEAAARLGLPLLVGEVGVDPSVWEGLKYRSFDYGLREVRGYQDLIRYARPRGTMQWEFTSDYGLVDEEKDPSTGAVKLVPHARFWFMKHFCDLTPADADVLETGSDSSDIMVTAFRGRGARGGEFTLHIANFGRSRVVALAGLPTGLGPLRAVRTSQAESFSALPNVKPEQGGLKLTMAGRSLLTLTTLPLSAQSSSDRSGQTLVAPQP